MDAPPGQFLSRAFDEIGGKRSPCDTGKKGSRPGDTDAEEGAAGVNLAQTQKEPPAISITRLGVGSQAI